MPLDSGPRRLTPAPAMARLLRLSKLALRWQLEAAAKKDGRVTRSTLERLSLVYHPVAMSGQGPMRVVGPNGGWVKVLMGISVAIAESRLPEQERANYARFKAEIPKLMANVGQSEKGRRRMQREIEANRAVFLGRFFPVPHPGSHPSEEPKRGERGEWHPGFWTPQQYDQIEQHLRAALRSIETPCEPQWWPDGWREALEGV